MKHYLKFFIFIIFLYSNVFAEDFDVTNTITAPTCSGTTCSGGHYTSLEIYNSGIQNVYSVGTRYNGQISTMRFNVPLPNNWPDGNYYSTGDLVYTLTLNMATDDWRNHFARPFISNYSGGTNFATSSVVYVSYKKIYFNFKIPSGTSTDFLYVYLQSPNQSTTAFTGVSNWNLSSVILTASFPGSGGSGGSGGATNNDIINNNNDNTNNIIENNNDNTNNIIENNNQNSQNIIDNQNENLRVNCKNLINFSTVNEYNFYLSENLNPNTTYAFSFDSGSISYNIRDSHNGELLSSCGSSHTCVFTTNSNGSAYFNGWNATFPLTNLMLVEGSTPLSYCKYGSYTNRLDSIVDNQNQNTQSIIDNQNQNTQQQIDSQMSCIKINKSTGKYNNSIINNAGQLTTLNGFTATDYIEINEYTKIKVLQKRSGSGYTCFYNSNKTKISCISNSDLIVNEYLNIPSTTSYVRFSIHINEDMPKFEICKDGNQAINDSITNSNVDSDVGTGFFDNFNDEDFGLSQIVTIPLTTIQSLTSSSCVPLQVPIPFTNSTINLPCMTEIYQTKFPSIYNLWKIVSFGIVAYLIAIDIFHIVKGFKDPESDKVEVLDL